MNILKKSSILFSALIPLFFFVTPVSAAAPDGVGPWADSVVSFSQGLIKNGDPVPAARSDTAAAVGVAEDDTVDNNFFSLGFGGHIILGFVNGISSGVFIVEATNFAPTYPDEKAKIEVSENGTTWVLAGNVSQDGTVSIPDAINCAKFVRITDISNPAIMPDAIADGYDVDGVRANGDACTPSTVTPTSAPAPTSSPSSGGSSSSRSSNDSSTGSSSNGSSGSSSSTSSSSNPSSPTSAPAPTSAPVFVAQATSSCPPNANPLVPCFPDTGNLIPRLPNTGIGPNSKNVWLLILSGAFVSLLVFSLARKKYKFLSK